MKHIYFVRHGETEGNLNRFFQFPETELSDAGHKGAQAVAERLKHLSVDTLIASPYTRAQQTAKYISEVIGKPVQTFDDIHERSQPESMRGKEIDSDEGQAFIRNYLTDYCDPDCDIVGFENYFAVMKRVESSAAFLESLEDEHIVVVSHGGFLRSLTAYLLLNKNPDMETNIAVEGSLNTMSNVGITEFRYDEGTWRLFTWNDHAHFAE